MSKRSLAVMWILVLISFLIGLWFYPRLPATAASHWDSHGQVDGYTSRFWGAFLIPLIALGIDLLLTMIPLIDPLRKNIASFRPYYEAFAVIFTLYLIFIQLFELLWNVGVHLNPNVVFPVGIGLLLLYLGFFLEHVKPNWFIGIRTPWTLSSERVWEKTHRLGAALFKVLGIAMIAATALPPRIFIWILLGGTIAVALALMVYSYWLYEREQKVGSKRA